MGISTHVLDLWSGRPAVGVGLTLSVGQAVIRTAVTDADGRCKSLLPKGAALVAGMYRLRFDTAAYFDAHGVAGLYPFVEIAFEVRDPAEHFHIPLLLTANGYTTYRGS